CPEQAERSYNERIRAEELAGFTTGVHGIDKWTTGMREGELWIVGALPGRGKTAFATQVAESNASHGVPTLLFSLEMSREELIRRMAGREVGNEAARNPRLLSEQDWNRMLEYIAEISSWPLYISDLGEMTAGRIQAMAHLAVRRHGIRLMIVDYLQLIKAPGK